jgi:hypothetical protein
MKELNKKEITSSVFGGKCTGVWLGTTDGEYGVCIGKSEN